MPFGSDDVVTMVGPALIVSENWPELDAPVESLMVTANKQAPARAAVPLKLPAGSNDKPTGRRPAEIARPPQR